MRGLSLVLVSAMVGGLAPAAMFGQADAAQSAAQTTSDAAKKTAQTTSDTAKSAKNAVTMPSDSEIADAKSKGMVWANEKSKVYHKADDSKFGKTKHGKFMTEADAQAAGYKLSGTKKSKSAAASSTAPAPQQ